MIFHVNHSSQEKLTIIFFNKNPPKAVSQKPSVKFFK